MGGILVQPRPGVSAGALAAKIDAAFLSSAAPTRTQSEKAFLEALIRQIADFGLIVTLVTSAAFVSILLIVANTMAFAVRERRFEIGVMKVLGFSGTRILGLVLGETLFVFLVGGVAGLGLPNVSQTPLTAMTEAAFLGQQSARTKRLVTLFGWPIALLMAIGAAAGALNTMMSSVADRTAEIATFSVLGFDRSAAFAATFAEALVLSLAGASVGALASYAALDGWQASTLGANGTQTAFQRAVLLQAGALALLVGAVGGALPAVAATRMPLVTSLRGGAS